MKGLIAGLVAFGAYSIIQTCVFHFITISRRALMLVLLWIACLPFYWWLFQAQPDDRDVWPAAFSAPADAVTFLSGGLVYFFLFVVYANVFYTAESSVSVRTMIELNAEPQRGLTLAELTARYRYDWMLGRRLRRLVHAGYLTEENGWYRTTARGYVVASVFSWFKRLLRLGPGG